ncbi:MAG: AAA family ATPase [Elusimicrobia bacterium]|nr:AAA family ATPase [Elusimicrobiota bacterium]
MVFENEITLLIKSKYPLICVETIDEERVSEELFQVSKSLDFNFYIWSLTEGLRVGMNKNPFYQTNEPIKMLKIIFDLLSDKRSSIFVLSDFSRFLKNDIVLRLFKDLVNKVKRSETTFILVGAEHKLPFELRHYAANISGGYPSEKEIMAEVISIANEFKNSSVNIMINISPATLKKIVKSLKGLSFQQIRNIINTCILKDGRFDSDDLIGIDRFKKNLFDTDGILEYFGSVEQSCIAGFENLKTWVIERKAALGDNDLNLPSPKGALLLGVQGCGKSLAAKVIAGELEIPLYRLDLSRLYSKYIGETEENLRKALKTIEKLSPVCLWIDEIEKIFASSSGEIDGGVSKRILGTLLTWMQERKDKTFIAATSNDIDNLPAELLRKGRFDEIFFADLPDIINRKEIFKIHILKRGLKLADFNLNLLAEASVGFSGAEIEQAVISALYRASGKSEKINTAHIVAQIKLTRPLSIIKADTVNHIRNWAKEREILPV